MPHQLPIRIPANTMLAVVLAIALSAFAPAGPTVAQTWDPTGLNGPVSRLFAPTSGAFFAQTPDGLMRSDDGGASWWPVPMPEGVDGASLGYIAVAPTNHQIIYLWAPAGVYRTLDDAASWSLVLPLTGRSSRALAVSEADPNVVYLGVAGSAGISSDFWFYRSLDGGESWQLTQEAHNSLCGWGVPLLQPHSLDPQRAFRASDCYAGRNTSDELDQSLDGGVSWTQIFNPRPQPLFPERLAGGRGVNPDRLYLGTRRDLRAGGGWALQRSDDGGGSWSEVSGHKGPTAPDAPAAPDTRILALAMDPTAPDRLFMALGDRDPAAARALVGGGVHVSEDGGLSWNALGEGVIARDLVLGVDGANLYAATDNGVWRLALR